jgi:hypothetical protein
MEISETIKRYKDLRNEIRELTTEAIQKVSKHDRDDAELWLHYYIEDFINPYDVREGNDTIEWGTSHSDDGDNHTAVITAINFDGKKFLRKTQTYEQKYSYSEKSSKTVSQKMVDEKEEELSEGEVAKILEAHKKHKDFLSSLLEKSDKQVGDILGLP